MIDMNKITNRQAICDTLLEAAEHDKDLVVVCSDSRGSASLSAFADKYPKQFVEMGIAEQNLVSVSAGLAACGKKVFAASPASFLSTRSYEQAKVDVAYSGTNVTLVGISGGISYGALGMTHHSCQDIAAFSALPGMRVYFPSDRFLTKKLIEALLRDDKPAYVRVRRQATEDIYGDGLEFVLNQAQTIREGSDLLLAACGEMVPAVCKAADLLEKQGIHAAVLDMYCIKPLDEKKLLEAAQPVKCVITVEEHSIYGGLGSIVSQVIGKNCPKKVVNLALPDEHLIAGENHEVFAHYGLDAQGIAKTAEEIMNEKEGTLSGYTRD